MERERTGVGLKRLSVKFVYLLATHLVAHIEDLLLKQVPLTVFGPHLESLSFDPELSEVLGQLILTVCGRRNCGMLRYAGSGQ